ncbi:hypothetical protein EII29_05985 [Leptotrichia sp. OH3620_COT-345]|uniref:hypothetical protein n=1 Tax=Leptotrichia sp. OH3620_COT-345 TaxID=2491048 RepID=UPI000F64B467|nr:hypothetical protein [Leptotrichia sp. OH3620_COT-345]RRD39589.1 hypothetical protein EII29_05985 [Leptotrichia sp. OH3620_COT-345]
MFDLSGLKTEHLLDMDMWKEKSLKTSTLIHFEEIAYYYTENYTYFRNSFSHNKKFNRNMDLWLNSREIAEIFIPSIEKFYFENSEMKCERQWRFDILYSVLEKNLKK